MRMPPARRRTLLPALPLLLALGLFWAGDARGEDEEPVAPPDLPKQIEVPLADIETIEGKRLVVQYRDRLGLRTQRYLEEAGSLAEKDQHAEAEQLLDRLRKSRLNSFEEAYVLRLLGFIAHGSDRPDQAIAYFREALATEALPLRDENQLRFGIGQLYISMGEWAKAIYAFKDWLHYNPDPSADGYFVQAIAYYQLKEYDAAIAHNLKALEVSSKPQEGWLRLLVALYSERQQFDKAAPVLEELLLRYPDKIYWTQLALINAARESYDVSLAVQQLAYTQGYVSEEKELKRLAQGFVYHSLPYQAAELVESELEAGRMEESPENYEMLANSWIAAREYDRALPPLQRAADLSDSGTFYVRLGQVYMQREEWDRASEFLRKALDKGDLAEKQGSAQVLLGIALYNAGELVAARATFERARGFDKNRAEADRWIEHISKELGQA